MFIAADDTPARAALRLRHATIVKSDGLSGWRRARNRLRRRANGTHNPGTRERGHRGMKPAKRASWIKRIIEGS
jgi:hypothetical protein